ncbi:MAG TPA: hypothetical protein VFS15_22095 [Kofleriaceae bacterium]|nr:hypothetical protein [Kofleriaceae bacterium]
MQRFACLLIGITAACGGGTDSGPAMLTGVNPPAKSVGARLFSGPDAAGNQVLGWKLEFFEQAPGADCLSADTKVVASLAIYTNQADDGSTDQAILATGDIPIVKENPPPVNGNAAATMSAKDLVIMSGIVSISEFHLTDLTHADRIKGTVAAGGMDGGTGQAVSLSGDFDAPYCPE